jgi:hypothetical protein
MTSFLKLRKDTSSETMNAGSYSFYHYIYNVKVSPPQMRNAFVRLRNGKLSHPRLLQNAWMTRFAAKGAVPVVNVNAADRSVFIRPLTDGLTVERVLAVNPETFCGEKKVTHWLTQSASTRAPLEGINHPDSGSGGRFHGLCRL